MNEALPMRMWHSVRQQFTWSPHHRLRCDGCYPEHRELLDAWLSSLQCSELTFCAVYSERSSGDLPMPLHGSVSPPASLLETLKATLVAHRCLLSGAELRFNFKIRSSGSDRGTLFLTFQRSDESLLCAYLSVGVHLAERSAMKLRNSLIK